MDNSQAALLCEKLKLQFDENSAADNPPKHKWRIAPSSLGDECVARLWYKWRWAFRKPKPGRIARIFQRGNNSEGRFTAMLRRAGWEVRDYAERLCYHPESDSYVTFNWNEDFSVGNGTVVDVHDEQHHIAEALRRRVKLKQWRVKLFSGHLSGYCDAKIRHPVHTENQWILAEYKTYNTKRFSHLVNKRSVKLADFEYYVQMVLYLKELDLPYCLFIAENKNDDDIYPEIIFRDDATAEQYLKTAHTVIFSKSRPARHAQSAAHHVCKMCDFVDICHNRAPIEINCRSCINCEPVEDGQFYCSKWQAVIPNEAAIMQACPQHSPIQ